MKRVILIVISFMVLSTAVLFVSCSGKTNNGTSSGNSSSSVSSNTNNNNSSGSNTTNSSSSKTFTLDELKKYNGQNGNPAYVAVNGTVYDVTNARRWKNGKHQNGIVAGMDLTSALPQSPHGDSVLKELPVVGKLK